jgi:uncharacterized protein YutE (UPF0331/DUF86 family)
MVRDDVVLNKMAIIERCVKRLNEEYIGHENELEYNFTKQDSIILNLQRACDASIDLAMRVVKLKKLGIPQESRQVFEMLRQENILTEELSKNLQHMVGFRNLAVHDYQSLNLAIVHSILRERLIDFQAFIDKIKNYLKNKV